MTLVQKISDKNSTIRCKLRETEGKKDQFMGTIIQDSSRQHPKTSMRDLMKQYAIHRCQGVHKAKTTGRNASTSQSSKVHRKIKDALENRITIFDQLGEFSEKDQSRLGKTGAIGGIKSAAAIPTASTTEDLADGSVDYCAIG